MKIILPFFVLLLFSGICQAQQDGGPQNLYSDTASYTNLETALREKNVPHRVEYVGGRTIAGYYFGAIVVRNLKTQAVTKGAYIGADSPIRPLLYAPRWSHKSYIDEEELDGLIQYLDSCNNNWRKEQTTSAVSYEYETKDKFRFYFAANEASTTWRFTLEFRNYYFFNKDNLSRARTEEIFDAFKLFRDILKRY